MCVCVYLVYLVTHECLAPQYEQRVSGLARSGARAGHHAVVLQDLFLTLHGLLYYQPARETSKEMRGERLVCQREGWAVDLYDT